MPKPTPRNFGLDAVRAAAISLVIICHSTPIYKPILEYCNIDVILNISLFWHVSILNGIYGRIFALPVTSFAFAALLPLITGFQMKGLVAVVIRFIAKISYGI
jgi:hypothetical protein